MTEAQIEQPRVAVGACRCPGTPHEAGDWVELHPEPSLDLGVAAHAVVQRYGDDPASLQVALTRAYLRYGISRWSFTDLDGDPVAVTDDNVQRLLPFTKGGFEVADRADTLYSGPVLRPLMARLSTRSQGGRTAGSISPTPATGKKRQRSSSRRSEPASGGAPSEAPTP